MAEESKQVAEAPVAEAPVAEAPVPEAPAQPEAEPSKDSVEVEEEVVLESDTESEEVVPQLSTFERLKLFLIDTNHFLGEYDDLVEPKEQHKSIILRTVNELRDLLVALLQRYILHTMVKEDFLYKHIKCCGEEDVLLNTEEFDEHYEEVHKEGDSAVSLPELATIQQYTECVRTYIALGKAVNNDLLFSLKRLLRKSNSVLAGHLG
ncbi:uncharacterized protein LOC128272301 [Anopheles cruzii]|uniref:uncharacterized protein LOC128272301 n=1 Tax=Anopheles cruzii TaxID=68878 RepID=UPI0022EC424B|nr:uncharacterized protein LOC128272301 [Anopheles cruzii]